MSNNSNYKGKIQFKQQNCDKPHIYKITNQIDGKYYYGVHDGSDTENYEGSGLLLKQAYQKHGKENFIKEILMWFDTEDEAYEYEAVVVNEKMINKNNPMCYNLALGGAGGDKYSCQTPERQAEISQKRSDTYSNKTPKQKAADSQSKRDACANRTPERQAEINQKNSETAKKQWEEKTPEQQAEFGKRMSEANLGEKNGMFGQGYKVAGENNGNHTQYQHPYNPDVIGNWRKISTDIKKNYPNKPQWNQISWKQKELLKIKEEQNEK